MTVLVSESVKPTQNATPRPTDSSRTPFNTILQKATVIFLSLPRTPDTIGLISFSQFALMQPTCLLINVSRGGIVDEKALIEALRQRTIAGAASDVFMTEPAGNDNSPLLSALASQDSLPADLPLILSPHVAWYSSATIEGLQRMTRENVGCWIKGSPCTDRIVV